MANTPGLRVFCQNYGFDQDCILDNLLFHNFFFRQNKSKTGPSVKELNNIILLLYDDNTRFFSSLRGHLR